MILYTQVVDNVFLLIYNNIILKNTLLNEVFLYLCLSLWRFYYLPVLGYFQSMYTEIGYLKLKEPRKDMK